MTRSTIPCRRAFSAFELLVVLACIAVIATLALPSVSNTDATKLRQAARLLVADFDYAQSASIGQGDNPCHVVFDASAATYYLARTSAPATPITDPLTRVSYLTKFGEGRAYGLAGVTISAVGVGGDSTLGFTAMGALDQGVEATITLRCGGAVTTITVKSSTGEASAP